MMERWFEVPANVHVPKTGLLLRRKQETTGLSDIPSSCAEKEAVGTDNKALGSTMMRMMTTADDKPHA